MLGLKTSVIFLKLFICLAVQYCLGCKVHMSSSTPFLQQAIMFLWFIFPSTTVSYFTGRELWFLSFNLLIFHHVARFRSGFSFLSKTDTPVSFLKTDGFIFPPDSSILYLTIFLFQTRTRYKRYKGKKQSRLNHLNLQAPKPMRTHRNQGREEKSTRV